MRVVIQRAKDARVEVEGKITGAISKGLVILLGVEEDDSQEDVLWLVKKITGLRILNDEAGKMNLSIEDIDGHFLVISQFTLYASTKKGNRPSYLRSAKPEKAKKLYEDFMHELRLESGRDVACGIFGADMQVYLCNDGPVTIWIDSRNRE